MDQVSEIQATDALNQVRDKAEKICNDEAQQVETMSIHDCIRQGDIYVIRISDEELKDFEKADKPSYQLAEGNTVGSRHILSDDSKYEFYKASNKISILEDVREDMLGPVFKAAERFSVTHPEHADVSLPEGNYAVTFQRIQKKEIQRVQD